MCCSRYTAYASYQKKKGTAEHYSIILCRSYPAFFYFKKVSRNIKLLKVTLSCDVTKPKKEHKIKPYHTRYSFAFMYLCISECQSNSILGIVFNFPVCEVIGNKCHFNFFNFFNFAFFKFVLVPGNSL